MDHHRLRAYCTMTSSAFQEQEGFGLSGSAFTPLLRVHMWGRDVALALHLLVL